MQQQLTSAPMTAASSTRSATHFGAYWQLTKPRVVALIVFTAIVGMLLAVPGLPSLRLMLFASIGIWLSAASAAAINHLLDARIDAKMARTQHRPLPTGGLRPSQVLIFALTLGGLSMVVLITLVNVLTAVLTFASLIGYAVIYTGWLKRATPQNIVIGGVAGAAPPLLGWAAMTDQVHPHALILVLIIFIWTPPHFWALAIFRHDDYAAADVPMLPVTHGIAYTKIQILLYTILLCVMTLMPYLMGMSGIFYLGGALVLNLAFLYYAIRLFNPPDAYFPMRVFNYSIIYLMALFAFLLVDHYLPEPSMQAPSVLQFTPVKSGDG